MMNEIKSPLKAIHQHCIECMGNQVREVPYCNVKRCPLYPFRLGKNPYSTRHFTEEQKQAAAERMKKAREAKKDN